MHLIYCMHGYCIHGMCVLVNIASETMAQSMNDLRTNLHTRDL